MVRQGLGRDAEADVMQLDHRHPDRVPASQDHLGRPIQPFRDLAQRANPVPSLLLGEFGRPLDGGDEVGEGRLQKRGRGHWDEASKDGDGSGCLEVFWEFVYSIYLGYTVLFLPNLDVSWLIMMYPHVL
jgi:hypothetical protein